MLLKPSLAASAFAIVATAAFAQTTGQPASDKEAMSGYMAVMDKMQSSTMMMSSSGDADADFLRMMIPHHQSAIDMAQVELANGDDEETRALAEKIIEAQKAEIEEIKGMLERMGVAAP